MGNLLETVRCLETVPRFTRISQQVSGPRLNQLQKFGSGKRPFLERSPLRRPSQHF